MRSSGSTSFSSEATIVSLNKKLNDVPVISLISNAKSLQYVHVAWNQNGNLMHTYTTNNGVKWNDVINVDSIISISQEVPSFQLLGFDNLPELVCFVYVDRTHKGLIKCTKGRNFPKKVAKSILNAQYINSAVCKGDNNMVFIVVRTVDMKLNAYIYNYDTSEMKQVASPFEKKYMYEFPQVSCISTKNKVTAKIAAYDSRELKEYLIIGDFNN